MMKKTMLHAMCLSASLLMMTGTTVSYAATANASVMAAAEEGGEEEPSSGATAAWEDESNKLLKVTVTAAGQFATWASSATDDYKAATRINVVGEGVTLNEDDLAAVEKFVSLKTLDLSKVTVSDYSKIKNAENVKFHLVIADAKDNADGTYSDKASLLRSTWGTGFDGKFLSLAVYYTNENSNVDLYVMPASNQNMNLESLVNSSKSVDNLAFVDNTNYYLFNSQNTIATVLPQLNKLKFTTLVLLDINQYNETGGDYTDLSTLTNENVKRVILPKGATKFNEIKLAENSNIKVLQSLTTTGYNEYASTDFYTYSVEAGGLNEVSSDHFYHSSLTAANSVKFSGNINAADFSFIDGVKNSRINLDACTHTTTDSEGNTTTINLTEAISKMTNSYVEYLVLPAGVNYPVDPTFKNLYTDKTPKLKGVGVYVAVTTTIGEGEAVKDSTERSIVINSAERGAAYQVEKMLGQGRFGASSYVAALEKVQISGLVSAVDLSKNDQNYVDADGHLSLTFVKHNMENGSGVSVNSTAEGATKIPVTSMGFCLAKSLDLSNVRLYDESDSYTDAQKLAAQNDLNIAALGWSGLTSIALPTDASAYRLTNGALYNIQGITSLCIPTNFTELGEHSLQNYSHIANIYTSDVKDGNRVWYINGREIDHEPTAADIAEKSTCTLPLNLTRIEFQALASLSLFTDVYVVNNKSGKVPYCERDAFDAASYYGYSGFNGTHPITRENYKNGTSKTFAILHFPNGLKREQTKLYTDITRNYTLTDETGATDDNGDLFVWPTQAQWIAAYSQASTGYNWEDWKMDEGATGGYTGGETYGDYLTETRETIFSTGDKASENRQLVGLTEEDLKKQDSFAPTDTDGWPLLQGDTYIGWHQFVLTGAYNMADDSNIWHSYITDDNWWTISLPFDMSKKQIEETFGEGTLLCTLTGVTRDASKNNITFNFGKDLVANAESEDATVLVNRAPYMIKPGKKEKLKNETDGEDEYSGPIFKLTTEQNETVSKLDLNSYKDKTIAELLNDETNKCAVVVNATNENGKLVDTTDKVIEDGATDAQNYKYIFVAQYTKYYIPTYGYFLGWDNDANKANYFYQKEKANVQNWNAYTCTIGHYTPSQAKWVIPAGTSTSAESGRWEFSCVDGDARSLTADNLPKSGDSEAKISMFFGADNTTSIEGISANGGIQTIPAGMVYNLNGQVVSTNGTAGLAKGIYIANGKKFIVK